ncbi:L-threonylcarbamoyladenylate synthase type 1 TsaC [Xenorhabdus budapestensis]|uniref:L-threonylcarbamoyladenylate synthase type 1 TsaC n=1 Tax=Xenorhabdus budapestensis TaxID=290110 RepID=UPI003A89E832
MSNKVSPEFDVIITALKEEKVVAYPTEAVFGLGCDPDSETAVNRLLLLKNRPWEKGLILISDSYERLYSYVNDEQLDDEQKKTVFSFWPGPVTWVIPAKVTTPKWLTGKFSKLAVRVTDHPLVKQLCSLYEKPLVSTSANLSGLEPCRSAEEVRRQFGNDFPVLEGEIGGRKNPSEIRDALTGKLYRQG